MTKIYTSGKLLFTFVIMLRLLCVNTCTFLAYLLHRLLKKTTYHVRQKNNNGEIFLEKYILLRNLMLQLAIILFFFFFYKNQ